MAWNFDFLVERRFLNVCLLQPTNFATSTIVKWQRQQWTSACVRMYLFAFVCSLFMLALQVGWLCMGVCIYPYGRGLTALLILWVEAMRRPEDWDKRTVENPTSFYTHNIRCWIFGTSISTPIINMINIGERIKEELLLQERSVTWLANKLGCTRMTIYRIFEKQSIDTQQLLQISRILNHDFFSEMSEDLNP